jgi:hypothetical protein
MHMMKRNVPYLEIINYIRCFDFSGRVLQREACWCISGLFINNKEKQNLGRTPKMEKMKLLQTRVD